MEVLETGNCLKESEKQSSGNNYGCRLPRDLTLGTNSVARSRVESDIGLLVACKAQLSSEVIRWKTESLRLQKECDSAYQQVEELDQLVFKISERAKDLESKLLHAISENEQLRTLHAEKTKENACLLQKLPKDLEKYHSFPWSESPSKPCTFSLSRNEYSEIQRTQDSIQEDWKDVSQKLLEKMKLEMKELQELSNHFLSQDKENDEVHSSNEEANVQEGSEELEKSISSLICETESLKHHLLQQRKKLQFLFNAFTAGDSYMAEGGILSASRNLEILSSSEKCDHFLSSKLSTNKFSRPSDESFRMYFTKQLGGLHDMDKMSQAMKLFLESSETKNILKEKSQQNSAGLHSSKLQSESSEEPVKKDELTEEERVCPICQAPFGNIIPQKEFEEHVLDHLEVESASLLDQYVVL